MNDDRELLQPEWAIFMDNNRGANNRGTAGDAPHVNEMDIFSLLNGDDD